MAGRLNGKDAEAGEDLSSQLTSPTALRKLVLNYLVHHCYTDTAQAFAHDGIPSSSSRLTESDGLIASSPMSDPHKTHEAANGSSSSAASGSTAPQTRSWSRMVNQQMLGQAHPLSAPPLSREDSSMEVEVDSLLSLAAGRAEDGPSPAENGHKSRGSAAEDTRMDDGRAGETGDSDEELSAGELRSVRIRREIKDHIITGRIRMAVDLCNTHFPTVLNADSTTSSAWEKEVEQSKGAKQTASAKETDTPSEGKRVLPANPTSLYPAHLSLNLQIQAFIESVRAASAAVPSNGVGAVGSNNNSTQSLSPATNAHGPGAHSLATSTPGISSAVNALSRSASPAPSSASSTSATSANGLSGHSNGGGGGSSSSSSTAVLNPVLHAALSHAQLLFTNVQKLPGYWRAMYLKELESVTALLAYTDLERSPVRKYLDQSRRVALAEQINSAIMFRTGKPSQPLIESAVRQTSYLWSTLSSEKVVVPTDHAIFTSGTVVGVDKFETPAATATTSERVKTKGKVLPSWNLHSFLLER